MGVATKSHKIRNRQPHLVHLLLDLCVLSALPVASAAATDVLVAVLVHLVVDIVAFIVSARLILRNNTKL